MSLDNSWFTEPVTRPGGIFAQAGRARTCEQTPYQKIEIYRTETFGYLMTIDGCTMVSTRDNFLYHEMMSHPMRTPPQPARRGVVGGGDCGTLREVLEAPGTAARVQVEIDERVTRLSEQISPSCASPTATARHPVLRRRIAWMKEVAPESLD